ncbi:MAG: hypothetical protein HC904_08505 [Blastochloris sp.]|nr:hypothetical protein [Blastochloris sp.]
MMRRFSGVALLLLMFQVPTSLHPADPPPTAPVGAFGSEKAGESSLIGILYDLKQTQQRQPVKDEYRKMVADFVNNEWDESILNRFYRVSRPLYLTQLFIAYSNADTAPKAFGVEKLVEPRRWLIHYKGQIQAPETGTFRFVGGADDVLAVARNGETVLFTTHPAVRIGASWKPSEESKVPGVFGKPLTLGDWWSVKEGEIMDLDIIVGEFPGGWFGAWLYLEKQGEIHPPGKSGRTDSLQLPVFQVAPYQGPEITGRNPAFRLNHRIWKALQ